MSNNVFPTLAGLGWSFVRTPIWSTLIQKTQSGRELRIANMANPLYKWSLTFDVLRNSGGFTELQTLMAFFNARQGSYDSFLFQDPDDNFVTAQQIGTGDGSTTTFTVLKSFGGFIEPVIYFNPSPAPLVYLNGVSLSQPGNWSMSNDPGTITFTAAPGAGVAITATYGYYYRCRFLADTCDFDKFMSGLWQVQKLEFQSLKP
ncbi:DUF2460 domain-containing protein [Trinickia mobilis]|uniref:DUF2460 domain-containing protein n=1 Tax=Trinickia mobilis TaxID=2816356 RepID=UPI001A8FDF87|nr:DUF2460 domain-containing protein [Trinickia mobilis]